MAHRSLFRKWRSQKFSEIVGQEHVSRSLQNAVRQGGISSAYLFCGPRGTGKTSVARILAKAMNCRQAVEGEPCNVCPHCRNITEGRSMDVMEIDAASHTQVEKVREHIINRIDYAPSEGRYKVYIIDEVHRLSPSSFDALLKTLEEPPAHAVFILATTEPHRLVGTIQSRCQRFDFRRIPLARIKQHLHLVAQEEGMSIDEEAIEIIARGSEGSMRDALVLLEQARAFSGDTISGGDIRGLLGITESGFLFALAGQILEGNTAGTLETLAGHVDQGGDLVQLNRDCLEHFRRLFLARVVGERRALENIAGVGEEQADAYMQQAGRFGLGHILRSVKIFLEMRQDMADSALARVFWELALVRLTRVREDPSLEALRQRMEYLEHTIGAERASTAAGEVVVSPASAPRSAPAPVPSRTVVRGGRGGSTDLDKCWPHFLTVLKSDPPLFAFVSEATPRLISPGELVLEFSNGYDVHMKKVQDQAQRLENLWLKLFGQQVRISCHKQDGAAGAGEGGPARGADEHQSFVHQVMGTFGNGGGGEEPGREKGK